MLKEDGAKVWTHSAGHTPPRVYTAAAFVSPWAFLSLWAFQSGRNPLQELCLKQGGSAFLQESKKK